MCLNSYMEEVLQGIKQLHKEIKEIHARFEKMDVRFENVEGEISGLKSGLSSVQASLDAHVREIRQDLKVQRDITTDMDLRMAEGFSDLKAGQAQLQAGIDKLRRDLFLEGGLRETADDAIHTAETERYDELAKRVLVLEERMGIAA